MNHTKSSPSALALAVLVFSCLPLRAAPQDDLAGLVREWSSIRTLESEETLAWKTQRTQLERDIALLEAEMTRLKHGHELAREALAALTSETDRLAALEAGNRKTYTALDALAEKLAATVGHDLPLVPTAVAARLPSLGAPTPLGRLQKALAAATALVEAERTIHVTTETFEGTGPSPRRAQALTIGLANAFAVAPDASWAAIGSPTPRGWHWTPRPELADAIQRAITLHEQGHALELVELPLQIHPVETGP